MRFFKPAGYALSTFLLLFSALGNAAPESSQVSAPVRGTISSINGNDIQVQTRNGDTLDVSINDQTRIQSVTNADPGELKSDSFIGTAAVPQADGTLKALEVHVFAPSLRGTGEGFRPFQSADGKVNTMTNGTVGKLVNANGKDRTMAVKYADGEKTIHIPDDVPIVYIQPGDKTLLKKGTQIVLFAPEDSSHHRIAKSISAGVNGERPPM